MEDKFNVKLK